MRRAAVAAVLGSVLAACAVPMPTAPPPPSASGGPSPSVTVAVATIPINVQFRGRVNCNLGFSYYCAPSLSVLEPGTDLPETLRPSESDASWQTRGDDMQNVGGRRWTLLRGAPATAPGRRLLVISLIGASDVASYNPDGTVATELMGRCSTEVDVAPYTDAVDIIVRFESEAETATATCTVELAGG
jgi:hypothetical protein